MKLSLENVARVVRILRPRWHAAVAPSEAGVEVRVLADLTRVQAYEFRRDLSDVLETRDFDVWTDRTPSVDLDDLARRVCERDRGSVPVLADALMEAGILLPVLDGVAMEVTDIERFTIEWALDTIWTPTRSQTAIFVEDAFATMVATPDRRRLLDFARIEFEWPEAGTPERLRGRIRVDAPVKVRAVSLYETHREAYYAEEAVTRMTQGRHSVRWRLRSIGSLDLGSTRAGNFRA